MGGRWMSPPREKDVSTDPGLRRVRPELTSGSVAADADTVGQGMQGPEKAGTKRKGAKGISRDTREYNERGQHPPPYPPFSSFAANIWNTAAAKCHGCASH